MKRRETLKLAVAVFILLVGYGSTPEEYLLTSGSDTIKAGSVTMLGEEMPMTRTVIGIEEEHLESSSLIWAIPAGGMKDRLGNE